MPGRSPRIFSIEGIHGTDTYIEMVQSWDTLWHYWTCMAPDGVHRGFSLYIPGKFAGQLLVPPGRAEV